MQISVLFIRAAQGCFTRAAQGCFTRAAQGCLLVIGLTACTTDRVVVDKHGLDQARYEKDLAECRDYKQQVPVGEEMAKGATVGAAVGGLLGATAGGSGRNSHDRGELKPWLLKHQKMMLRRCLIWVTWVVWVVWAV